MSDVVGLLGLPVAATTVTPYQERDLSPGDPALVQVASFAASVLQADCNMAWTVLSPGKPDIVDAIDGTLDGTGPARRAFFDDPRRGYFNDADLPALFVYRAAQTTSQWLAADCQRLRSQIVVAWVMPPTTDDDQRRQRSTFFHAVRSALHLALSQRRHASWTVDGDLADPDGLKTAFATSTSPVTISSFNGVLAGETMTAARPITITTAPAVGAYNTTAPIPVTALLDNGLAHTESVYLTDPDGGETIKTIFPFVSPTTVALPEMVTTAGSIEIGYADSPDVRKGSLLQRACRVRSMLLTRTQTSVLQVPRAEMEPMPHEAIEFFLDVAEDSAPDPALRGFDPWDVEAHGTREHPSDDVFEFVIED